MSETQQLGGMVRVGRRRVSEGVFSADTGYGNTREVVALDWRSDDGAPCELELSILPAFMDSAASGSRPTTMAAFRWGATVGIGGQQIAYGGAQPSAPIAANGVKARLTGTTVRVQIGVMPYSYGSGGVVDSGWVDVSATLAPIVGSGSTQVQQLVQVPLAAAVNPAGAVTEVPKFAREWRAYLQDAAVDITSQTLAVLGPHRDTVREIPLANLLDWAPLDIDAFAFDVPALVSTGQLLVYFR